MIDYYEVLEVSPNVSEEVLKKAYYSLVQKYHPDQFHSEYKKYATERTRLLNEAYRILSDPDQRRRYDVKLAQYTRITPSGRLNKGMHPGLKIVVLALMTYVVFRMIPFISKAMSGFGFSGIIVAGAILIFLFWFSKKHTSAS